jgi:hypothetical protein
MLPIRCDPLECLQSGALAAVPRGSMSTHGSIYFIGSVNLAHRAQHAACTAGVKIMNTSLSFARPQLVIEQMPDECCAASSRTESRLTIEQRMQIDMFLAPLQAWTVGATAEDASWQVTSCFAPRLHRDGDIDFVAPYLAGSHALSLIAAHPVVTFLVSDREAGRWLEGRAQTVAVQHFWEQAELLAYLRWRIPGATDGLSGAIEVLVFQPIYLRYYDRWSDSAFEAKW